VNLATNIDLAGRLRARFWQSQALHHPRRWVLRLPAPLGRRAGRQRAQPAAAKRPPCPARRLLTRGAAPSRTAVCLPNTAPRLRGCFFAGPHPPEVESSRSPAKPSFTLPPPPRPPPPARRHPLPVCAPPPPPLKPPAPSAAQTHCPQAATSHGAPAIKPPRRHRRQRPAPG